MNVEIFSGNGFDCEPNVASNSPFLILRCDFSRHIGRKDFCMQFVQSVGFASVLQIQLQKHHFFACKAIGL